MCRLVVVSMAAVGVVVVSVALALSADRTGAFCLSFGAPGPATVTHGPVEVSVEQTVYQPSELVIVTVTNHLSQPIWLVPPDAYVGRDCSTYVFVQQAGQWLPDLEPSWCRLNSHLASGLPPQAYGVEVLPYGHVHDRVGGFGFRLSPGTYRVGYRYILADPAPLVSQAGGRYWVMQAAFQGSPSIASQPFHVCICGRCG